MLDQALPSVPDPERPQDPGLTETDLWILSEIVRGTSTAEMALQLLVYENTVTQRIRSILRKLGVRTRAEAATWLLTGQRYA
jgi:DNA-binding NarL/FixJ family response regulator